MRGTVRDTVLYGRTLYRHTVLMLQSRWTPIPGAFPLAIAAPAGTAALRTLSTYPSEKKRGAQGSNEYMGGIGWYYSEWTFSVAVPWARVRPRVQEACQVVTGYSLPRPARRLHAETSARGVSIKIMSTRRERLPMPPAYGRWRPAAAICPRQYAGAGGFRLPRGLPSRLPCWRSSARFPSSVARPRAIRSA